MQNTNVPNGWVKTTLGKVGEVSMCKRIMKHQTNDVGGVPFFKIGTFGGIADAYIDKDLFYEYKKKYSYPNIGDILLSAAGTIGRLVIFDGNDAYFQDSNIVWVANDEKLVLNKYLYHLYCTIKWRTSEGGIVSRLDNNERRKSVIVIPPINEQEKIAEILGTWDRAIEELTGLIAEKKELKRGLMQRLLTGTQRLSGFSASWKQVKLAELFDVKKGAGLSKDVLDKEGKESCILYGELYTTYSEIVRSVISRTDISEGVRSEYGDILIPGSTTTTGIDLANATALLEKGVLLGGDINILRKKQELSSEFFAYLLTHAYRFELAKLAQSITIVHLYGESLKNVDVVVPTDAAEQKAIADMLSKADSEIDLLNQQLDVLKEQKRGLMQKLLTGEIRVKVDNE